MQSGVIRGGSIGSLVRIWLIAGFCNAWSLPTIFVISHAPSIPEPLILGFLIFPLIGLMLLASAVMQTLRMIKYGRSTLTLTPLPAHPGETCQVVIDLTHALSGGTECVADLQCVRIKPGRNGPTESIVWQDDHCVHVTDEGGTIRLGTVFDVPFDALTTTWRSGSNRIFWRLIVSAHVPGINYREMFNLPVFARNAGNAPPLKQSKIIREKTKTVEISLSSKLATQRIWLQTYASGDVRVEFPPARNLGASLLILFFAAIFVDVIVFMIRQREFFGWLFIVPIGAFALLFGLFGLISAFVRTTLTANSNGLSIVHSVFAIPVKRHIDTRSIDSVTAEQNQSAGNSVCYSLKAKQPGKRFGTTVSSSISGHETADCLAAVVAEAVGLF